MLPASAMSFGAAMPEDRSDGFIHRNGKKKTTAVYILCLCTPATRHLIYNIFLFSPSAFTYSARSSSGPSSTQLCRVTTHPYSYLKYIQTTATALILRCFISILPLCCYSYYYYYYYYYMHIFPFIYVCT
ncbi:hypothetical protein BX666DRAFT_748077 [Dichotomocladium elegans]|nr:hypothetical protein BX666DRAFT_748077 [Dichotomocladium elegans]